MEIKDNKMQVCPQCHGDCMVYTDVPASGGYDCVYERCETCDAEGVVEIDEDTIKSWTGSPVKEG